MKTYSIVLFLLLMLTPGMMAAQNWQTSVSVDSRVGYSSNTYLNPFLSVWDPTAQSTYGLVSLFGQGYWSSSGNSLEITGGAIAESFLNNKNIWKGGLGLLDYRRRLSSSFNVGLESGGSYFTGLHSSGTAWLQPYVSWFASPFTSLRLKGGTYFQSFDNLADTTNINRRSEVYAIEFETWPSYHWQIKAAAYSSLDKITAPQEQFRSRLSAGYLFLNGTRITAHLGFEQYQFQFATQNESEGPGPPIDVGPGESDTSQGNNRIFRAGLTAHYPINRTITLFATVEGLKRTISTNTASTNDYKFSGGVRLAFQPKIGASKRGVITPQWDERSDQTMMLKVKYSGGGRLYLVGDFNNWNRTGIPLARQSKNTYTGQVEVSVGAYEYKILHVEGATEEWLPFSGNTYTVDDGYGGENAMLLVE